jgi:hypothetical protein
MADRVLFISWSSPISGREERGLEVFNEAIGLHGRLQQDGRTDSFDVVLLGANGSGINGYIEVHGSAQQLAALRDDEEFTRNLLDASLVVKDLQVSEGYTNEGIARQMQLYQEAIGKVAQTV